MRRSTVALVLLGVAAAVCAAVLAAGTRSAKPSNGTAPTAPDVQIVVAQKPLDGMTVVRADAVTTKTVSAKEVGEDYFSHPAQVIGRVLSAPMVEGQAFTNACFVTAGTGMRIATALSEGKRAVCISLQNSSSALEGLLYPGCTVDVVAAFRSSTSRGKAVSTTILSGVQVLAVGDSTILAPDGKSAGNTPRNDRRHLVTLMVDPKQAQDLRLAMQHGSISLTMRNPTDRSQVDIEPARFEEMSHDRHPEESPAAPSAPKPEVQPEMPSSLEVVKSKWKLNAIVHGPGGAAAVINDSLVEQGATVGGAKVIKIAPHTVEIEVQGQRFQLTL